MRRFGSLAWLVWLTLAPAALRAEPAPETHRVGAASAEPTREWSEPADFEALRLAWAARPDFSARCVDERPLTPAIEALRAQRWEALLALAEPWSRRCPVDMEAHELRAQALAALGRLDEAGDAEMWARGLFEAALASGDGAAPATAYRVIADFEAYALLRAFHAAPRSDAPAADGTDRFHVVRRASDGEGEEEADLYFAPLRTAPKLAHASARGRD